MGLMRFGLRFPESFDADSAQNNEILNSYEHHFDFILFDAIYLMNSNKLIYHQKKPYFKDLINPI